MLTRRALLASSAAAAALIAAARLGLVAPAMAQDATGFIVNLGNAMVGVVNSPGSLDDKKRRLTPLIEQSVDIEGIGRFCLGRFWRTASPEQQGTFQQLFHRVLINNIAGKLGEFQGVSFSTTTTTQREGDAYVGTIIRRPNQQPNNVQWVVGNTPAGPKIIDVVAEGTSLRLTQRSDYAAYLSRNNNNIDALLGAMRQQVGG